MCFDKNVMIYVGEGKLANDPGKAFA